MSDTPGGAGALEQKTIAKEEVTRPLSLGVFLVLAVPVAAWLAFQVFGLRTDVAALQGEVKGIDHIASDTHDQMKAATDAILKISDTVVAHADRIRTVENRLDFGHQTADPLRQLPASALARQQPGAH